MYNLTRVLVCFFFYQIILERASRADQWKWTVLPFQLWNSGLVYWSYPWNPLWPVKVDWFFFFFFWSNFCGLIIWHKWTLGLYCREMSYSAQPLKLCPDFQRCWMPAAPLPLTVWGLGGIFENQATSIKQNCSAHLMQKLLFQEQF